MKQDSAPTRSQITARLARLRALAEDRGTDEYGRREIAKLLKAQGQSAPSDCPRYAAVLLESGDPYIIVAETLDELAVDIGNHVAGEIPLSPDRAIDLDTGDTREVAVEVAVSLGEPRLDSASRSADRCR